MDNEDVYAPPQSELEKPTDEIALASRWYRLWGALIDGVIGIAIGVGSMFVTGYWDRAMRQEITPLETFGFGVFGFVMFFVIHGYFLARDGQTVGKKLVGTRIVSSQTNEILPLGKLLILRYLPLTVVSQIPLVGGVIALVNYLFIFRKDKRCIHDLIAGTKVIKASAS
jgi:uncharacterized RDD family membrane protein YckC